MPLDFLNDLGSALSPYGSSKFMAALMGSVLLILSVVAIMYGLDNDATAVTVCRIVAGVFGLLSIPPMLFFFLKNVERMSCLGGAAAMGLFVAFLVLGIASFIVGEFVELAVT
ncbi:MAG: hypothetical protein AAGH71_00395 [Planctomycetota bacterium]